MKKCIKCGAELEMDSNFCTNCGAKQPTLKICVKCGTLIEEDANFCTECGANQNEMIHEEKEQIVVTREETVSVPTPVAEKKEQGPESQLLSESQKEVKVELVPEKGHVQVSQENSIVDPHESLQENQVWNEPSPEVIVEPEDKGSPVHSQKKYQKDSGNAFMITLYAVTALVVAGIIAFAVYVTKNEESTPIQEIAGEEVVSDEDVTNGAVEKVREIYADILPTYLNGGEDSDKYFKTYCTREWNELLKAENEGRQDAGEEMGVIDFDLWIWGQDWDSDLALLDVKEEKKCSEDSVWVMCRLLNCGSETKFTLVMKRESGEWKVDDFRGNDGLSLKKNLQKAIKEYNDYLNDRNIPTNYSFSGFINEKYEVVMTLHIEDGEVHGRYYYMSSYEKYGDVPSTYITLDGTIDENQHINMLGTFYNSNRTEEWNGWLRQDENNNYEFQCINDDGNVFTMLVHENN